MTENEKADAFLENAGYYEAMEKLKRAGWYFTGNSHFGKDESDNVISADLKMSRLDGGGTGTLEIRPSPKGSKEKYTLTFRQP